MSLVNLSPESRIAFDKAAIMRRAHVEGRFALRMCRSIAERRATFGRFLRQAWATAKAEACTHRRHAEEAVAVRAALAARAAKTVALAASLGSATAIRQEIEAEHYRQHFNPRRIDALRGALASIGG